MFEKEAEELFKKKPLGYEMKPELEIYTDGFKDGYNKANEWHYPSKGEYPKDEKKVLVQLKDVDEPILDYYRQDGLWNYALEDEVIAWKEIVLPELKESE